MWAPLSKVNSSRNDKYFDWSKFKEFADNNFEFDERGGKLSKWVETLGKGELVHYKQVLLFPWYFEKTWNAQCKH